jgi:hypothetical protein
MFMLLLTFYCVAARLSCCPPVVQARSVAAALARDMELTRASTSDLLRRCDDAILERETQASGGWVLGASLPRWTPAHNSVFKSYHAFQDILKEGRVARPSLQ